ncbi:uncharacterized protein LOC125232721 [Leguminivora glycinivorella]|uniref:uncharacterized protein LOC125232721 n=1 Tax=Leguminivora glycinivorella TaxID=1035111 RepID=UPI00200BF0D4|nr:uncharacterized protein LOC125232721 [Leguminivora glycinivorella]
MFLYFVFYIVLILNVCDGMRYDGYMLMRGLPANKVHLDFFKNVTKNYDVDVWQAPGSVNKPVDFVISPEHAEIVKSAAISQNIPLEILQSDIQSAFDNQTVNTYRRRNTDSFTWDSYYRANDIVNWLKDLQSKYPKEIKLFSIGKTAEGRDIMCVKIVLKGSKPRSKVIIEGNIHAREWITSAMATYIINELIHAPKGKNKEWNKIANNYEWYIIPLLNVDGYEYSHTTSRMWRKNRRGGFGVDLNRNFDIAFGTDATETSKKSPIYAGPKPFSEPETKSLRKFMKSASKGLTISHYISIHSYGQLFIIPYAYTTEHLENFSEMEKIGKKVAKRILKRYGTKYVVGTAYDTVGYTASGVSACWVKKAYKVRYVNVFELRDTGKYGFALPINQIKPTCLETMDGLMELLKPRESIKLSDYEENESQPDGTAVTTLNGLALWRRYDGFMLLRGLPANEQDLEFFKNVTKNYDVNVWQPPGLVNKPVDFIISPDHANIVKSAARSQNISLETLHDDIQTAFDNQTVNTYSRRNTKSFNFDSYYRPNDIINWMMDIKTQYPEEISLFSIGKSLEGRDIMCMKIIFKGSKRRSKVVIEGGIHAREWIGTAMVTYIINELIHARNGLRDNFKTIAYNYEWFIIPIFNIDGYEYTHTTDRMWRKNRRGGYGVDLNRNFDAAFGTVGVTLTDKDSEEYCGPKAFSEPETQHLRRFMQSTNKGLPISHYMSFHAYGQLFIIPYAYTKKHLDNFNEMKKIGDRAATRIKKRYGTEYTVGTAFDTVGYMAAGVSACWAKKTFNIPYVNVFELRDTGKHGFALPAHHIKHTCLETMDGLMEVLKPRHGTKLSGQDDMDGDTPGGQAMTTFNGMVVSINVFIMCAFDDQTVKRYFRHHLESFTWEHYYGLDDIYNWLRDFSIAHPNEVQLLPIGKSIENRDIFAVRLKLNKAKICKNRHRPKVIVEGGSHGREWISPAVVTYMIYALVNANNSNSEELKLVAPMYDWFFVPVMNPDGYVYSQTHDRLWKKNRRGDYGVDLNRNFGILFGKLGSKRDKIDDEYCGTEPFSEPESAAMATFARDNSFSLEYYLSFHAYGQYIILPYSFSRMYEDNYNSTKKLAELMAEKLFTKYQIEYKVGTNFDTQGYLASGVSADWVKRAINVTHVATIMLPDTGAHGLALPPKQILPTCVSIMDGLLAFLDPPQPEDVKRDAMRFSEINDKSAMFAEFLEENEIINDYAPKFDSSRYIFVCNVIVYMFSRFR